MNREKALPAQVGQPCQVTLGAVRRLNTGRGGCVRASLDGVDGEDLTSRSETGT